MTFFTIFSWPWHLKMGLNFSTYGDFPLGWLHQLILFSIHFWLGSKITAAMFSADNFEWLKIGGFPILGFGVRVEIFFRFPSWSAIDFTAKSLYEQFRFDSPKLGKNTHSTKLGREPRFHFREFLLRKKCPISATTFTGLMNQPS